MSIISGIILLIASSVIVALLALEGESNSRLRLLSLTLFSGVVIFYVRTGFGRYFTTIDESYYVSLLGDPHWYLSSIVSGYITPFSLHILRPFFATPVDEVVWYSLVMAMVYVLFLFFSYRKLGLSQERSVLAVFVLFMTPLYLWSVIQVRPQQIGLLVGFLLTALFLSEEIGKKGKTLLVLFLCPFLVFSHVLSFILYSALLVSYLSLRVFIFNDREAIRSYGLLVLALMLSWLIFLLFPYSDPILKNITWLLNSVTGLGISASIFSVISFVFLSVGLAMWYLFLLRFRGRLSYPVRLFQRTLVHVSESIERGGFLLFAIFVLVAILILVYIQFRLGSSVYSWVYRGSLVNLLLFQVGNITFAFFYLRGILTAIRRSNIGTFELLSLVMLIISLSFLVLSFFMPRGNGLWGFRNWLIRALQYFVPLAAPVVVDVLRSDIDPLARSFRGYSRLLIPLLLGILITVSVLNTARVPGVYNYDAVWSKELVDLCPSAGTYVPRMDGSIYSHFVEGNLLKACGGTLESKPLLNADISMSSDGFYRYWGRVRSLSIGRFVTVLLENDEPPIVLAGGSAQLDPYIIALFSDSSLIQLSPGGKCPLESLFPGRDVVLVGGPVVNPCTRELGRIGAFNVYLTANSVITPHSVYHVPTSNPWWNRREGLFVIQTLEYMGRPVVVIEGTDRDSTLAGISYFINKVYYMPEKYADVSYLVGKWNEADGKVIEIAKGSEEDTNGFSPGDVIKILEKG